MASIDAVSVVSLADHPAALRVVAGWLHREWLQAWNLTKAESLAETRVRMNRGALPLALGTGNGAEMRQPLGIAIVGGLVFSQILTLYTTPVVYLYMDRLRLRLRRRARARVPALAAQAGQAG